MVGHGMHDPFGPAPDGIPITVKITVDPDAGMIKADLTDNIDCLPAGVNESGTRAMNNCMTGIFNSIDPDIPHNAGTFRRVKVKLRENCVVGIPRFPHSCSVATTNVGERLVVTHRTIADAWEGYGLAEGACGIGPGFAVVKRDGSETELEPIAQVVLEPGEVLGHALSGGGGYGSAFERERELAREDVLARFVSFERAQEVYGVAFESEVLDDSLAIDHEATAALRSGS
jgi:N-methylhydantoinase B/oxoprolinase/acetone carboxylase alpha subunit